MTVKSYILKGWGLGLSLGQHPEGHISYDDGWDNSDVKGHAASVSQTAHFPLCWSFGHF